MKPKTVSEFVPLSSIQSKVSGMSTPESSDGYEQGALCQPSSSVESSGGEEEVTSDPGPLFPVAQPSLLAQRLLRLQACRSHLPPATRRKREMTPADKKDSTYWDKRHKNNEAAKRSREKRRLNDLMLEGQLLALNEENAQLRADLLTMQYHIRLGRETSAANVSSSTATASVASPLHYPTPNIFQAGLWGHSRGNPASILGMQHLPRARVSSVAPAGPVGVGLGPQSPQSSSAGHHISQQGVPHFFSSSYLSTRGAPESGGPADAERTSSHHQVSSSNDLPGTAQAPSHSASSTRASLPTSNTIHLPPTLSSTSHLHQSWLMPRLNHPTVRNSLLLPWGAPCLASSPAFYPSLPLYVPIEGREDQGHSLGQGIDLHRGFRGRFNSLSAELAQLRRYLSPDRC